MRNDVWHGNTLGLDGSRVIDRKIYLDESLLQAEQEELFARTWQWIAHETELPAFGDYITATIAGRPVVVVRGEDGAINGFYNTCTHRGAIIAVRARGNCGGSFTCMYHAWCFGVEGKLVSASLPAAYGDGLKKGCYDIPRLRVELFAGNVFINLDSNAAPLKEFLADSAPYVEQCTGDWEALGRVRWMLEGNWKLWHENFRDNYHPMYAHQFLTYSYQGVKIEGENIALGKGHSAMPFPQQGNAQHYANRVQRLTGRPFEARPRFQGGPDDRLMIVAIFPNMDLQHGTGPAAHTLLQTVRPISVDRAVVEIVAFGPKGEPAEARQGRLESTLDFQTSAGKISGDDVEAARRCAKGFRAAPAVRWSNMDRGQDPGHVGQKNDEYSLRNFYEEYKKYLGSRLAALAHVDSMGDR